MSSRDVGNQAEIAAKVYLEMRGYKIIEQNWRRPRAEIDIVAKKDGRLYFVEVKYRHGNEQGSGFDAITSTKLKQMQKAAWLYVDEEKWRGEYSLAAIELTGQDFTVMSFIENAF